MWPWGSCSLSGPCFSLLLKTGSEQVGEAVLGAAHLSQRDGEGIEMGREGFREKRRLQAEQGLPVRLGGIRMGVDIASS